MPRVCTVCTHPQRAEIDKKLATGECVKRDTAIQYGFSRMALWRHATRHLEPELVEAAKVTAAAESGSLVARVTKMVDRLERTADKCDEYGTYKDLLAIARELRPYHELFGKANGQLATDRVNALFVNLGVRSEDELKGRLALVSGAENLSLAEIVDSACEAIEVAVRKEPELYHSAMRRLERASLAVEVVNGNGKHAADQG